MGETEVVFYAACLTMALQHLHSRGIAYRDLKSENVLLSGGFTHAAAGWPVLADFGLATWVQYDGSSLQTFCGTPAFIAPEVAAQNGYGTAADWWSLGVLIYQCLTLCTPFEGATPRATIENIIHGRRIHSEWLQARLGGLSESVRDLIDALLHPDPAERLGGPLRGNEVRVHPFFWGFDWSQIEKRQMTPPHAARCRERAVTTTHHPSLQLPALPALPELPELPELPDVACAIGAIGTIGTIGTTAASLDEEAAPSSPRGRATSGAMSSLQMEQMEGATWLQEAEAQANAAEAADYV